MAWKKLFSKSVYKNHWMEVSEDEVETNTGRKLTFGVVHKKPFALVIPWDGEHFTLVGQYRYAIGDFSWEFPQGHFEHRNILETARKELAEETGLYAKQIKEIGTFYIGPGLTSQSCHVFLATELSDGVSKREESEEDMQNRRITENDLERMIVDDAMKDGPSIAAFSLLKLKKYV